MTILEASNLIPRDQERERERENEGAPPERSAVRVYVRCLRERRASKLECTMERVPKKPRETCAQACFFNSRDTSRIECSETSPRYGDSGRPRVSRPRFAPALANSRSSSSTPKPFNTSPSDSPGPLVSFCLFLNYRFLFLNDGSGTGPRRGTSGRSLRENPSRRIATSPSAPDSANPQNLWETRDTGKSRHGNRDRKSRHGNHDAEIAFRE